MKRKYRNFFGIFIFVTTFDRSTVSLRHFPLFLSSPLSRNDRSIKSLCSRVGQTFQCDIVLESRVDFTSLLRTCYIRARNTLHMQLSRRVATTGRTSVSVGQREADKVDVVNVICDAFEWYLNQRGVVGVVAVGWGLDRNVFETHFQSWKFRFLLRLRTNRD